MIPSVLFDYVIWVAISKYQTPPKGGKGGCAFIAWISIFEVSWGFEWLFSRMEEDTSQPSAPSNGANGGVVNSDGYPPFMDESFLQFVKRLGEEHIEPLDSSEKPPESEWDTSLVNRPQSASADMAVPSRDYHALLFTARVDLADDQDLKLPWETGILKTIFDEESDVVPLPSQVLSVSGEVLGAWVDDSGAASSLEPKEKTLAWLSRDISLPVHACAVKVS